MTWPAASPRTEDDPAALGSAHHQLAFLAEASALLAASLDYERTLQSVVRLAVPALADVCVADVLDDDGTLRRVGLAAADPAREEVLRELVRRYPPDPQGAAIRRVLRSGRPWVVPAIREEFWQRAAQDAGHLALIRQLGVHAAVVLPLVARDRTLGAITLALARPGRAHDPSELTLAEELARRAAVAIDNARLYRDAQEAKERASRHAARLQAVAEASRAFAEASLHLDAVLQVIVRRIVELVGDVCLIRLPSADGRWLEPVAIHHPDPDGLAVLQEMLRAAPQGVDEGLGGQVMQTGEAVFMPRVDVDVLRRTLKPEYQSYLGRFPVHSMLIVPLRAQGRVTGVLAVSREQPGRPYELEDQLLLHDLADRAGLAIENARLYRQADAARLQAEAASRAKDEFLATLSHELRTPLSAILAWAQLMRMGPADERTRGRGLEIIERNTRLQVQLMEDMLDVSRIVTGKLHLETTPTDVRAVTEAAIEVVAPTAEAKGIRLLSALEQGTATVWGDPARLQQVVLNLLSNAVKFTPRGGRIEIRLECECGQARITVTDTGRGILADLLPHVFDRFCQGDTTTTRVHGGLGLGLAIARHLTERHGGTVRAESDGEGRGARFTVNLPLAKAKTAAAAGRGPAGLGRLEGVHVLLVEDREDAREVFLETFERTGARVTAVGSVAAAMETLAREWPDVLVSDIAMPGEDGYALIEKIRALEGHRDGRLPAVALTAYAGADTRARALASGYDLHVAKPVQPTALIASVAGLVRDRL